MWEFVVAWNVDNVMMYERIGCFLLILTGLVYRMDLDYIKVR